MEGKDSNNQINIYLACNSTNNDKTHSFKVRNRTLKPHNYQLCALPLSYFESLLNSPLREKLSSRFRITGATLSGFQ